MDEHIGQRIGMALFGGALIALSSSLNYIFFGKITGLSGYLFYVLGFKFGPLFRLRLCFLVGMVTVVDLYYNFAGRFMWGLPVLDKEESINILSWILGGLLIGFGVRWSGGCTSGHGVCGLPRFSKRSLIAVCIFMSTGIGTASINAVIGPLPPELKFDVESKYWYNIIPRIFLSAYQLSTAIYIIFYLFTNRSRVDKIAPLAYFVMGCIFGLGLLISGMCSRQKILHFLALNKDWDPSLAFVMASAVGINLLTFQYIIRRKSAVFVQEVDLPDTYLDKGIYIGPAMFGVGWGLTGLCPGPALTNITVLGFALFLVVLIFSGQYLHDFVEKRIHSEQEEKSHSQKLGIDITNNEASALGHK
jgi:uncharacterized membrane protein YedE/YeeE